MPRIDPNIFIHEINTYPDAKLVRQRLCLIHPRKVVAIKDEVEKLLRAGFIYPIPLTEWVSNIVPVTKKQGNLRVCVVIGILIKSGRKTIILPPISTKSLIIVPKMKFFHL